MSVAADTYGKHFRTRRGAEKVGQLLYDLGIYDFTVDPHPAKRGYLLRRTVAIFSAPARPLDGHEITDKGAKRI